MGCYGATRQTSPNIDALARDGVVFRSAYTTGTWTKPVATPLVTGIHPSCLESQSQSLAFGGYQHFLQKIAKEKGFKTRVFGTNLYFSKSFGFTEGFDDEVELDSLEKMYETNPSNKEVADKIDWSTTSTIPSQYLHELFYKDVNLKADKNFTVFWSMDCHSPYYVKGNKSYFNNSLSEYLEGEMFFWSRNRLATRAQKFFRLLLFNLFGIYDRKRMEKIKSLYCDAIKYNDERIGELIKYLKERGEYENTLFILFGDHGEQFMEHGEYGHCSAPYNEVIKIPLIVKFPGQEHAGREVKEVVSILDIYPTILEILGVKGNLSDTDGKSLIKSLQGSDISERKIFIESSYKKDLYSAVLIKGNRKYFHMESKGNWLRRIVRMLSVFPNWFSEKEFDLDRDPEELRGSNNVSPDLKKDFEEMKKGYYQRVERYKNYKREMVDSAKVFEKLRNLGYF